MQKMIVKFLDGKGKTFPCDSFNPNQCECLLIKKEGLEDVYIPLRNVKYFELFNSLERVQS